MASITQCQINNLLPTWISMKISFFCFLIDIYAIEANDFIKLLL